MHIRVTGGAGYIGSRACKALRAAGYKPIVYDDRSLGHADAVTWGPMEIGDIGCWARLDAGIAAHTPSAAIHFVALAFVSDSIADPAKHDDVNIGGTLTLLEALRGTGIGFVVFSSSCATCGLLNTLPITEEISRTPINPYGFTKPVIERALADYERIYGIRWAALHYFNAADYDPDGELGERHAAETHAIIPLAIQAALGAGPQFQVIGVDYPTKDGSAVRNYIHVAELADAQVRAVKHLAAGGENGEFNLGAGIGVSVLELLAAVSRMNGRSVSYDEAPCRAGHPPALYTANNKAARVLGWQAKWRAIDATVAGPARWFARARDDRSTTERQIRG